MAEHWLIGSYLRVDNDWRRAREVAGYGVGYTQSEVAVGYRYELELDSLPGWASRAGPDFRLGHSDIFGDQGNMWGDRSQWELRIGWRHYLFGNKYLRPFVQPRVGVGKGTLQSNFGGGEIDVPEVSSTTLNMQALAGVGFCITNSVCVDLFAGQQWERSVSTDPAYLNNGSFFGVDLSCRLWGDREKQKPAVEEERVNPPAPPPPPPLVLSEIFFAYRSIEVPPDAFGHLDYVAASLRVQPPIKVRLHGYGNDEEYQGTNRVYSLSRAHVVRNYLVERGVPPDQILVDGEYLPSPGDSSIMVDARGESAHGGVEQYGNNPGEKRNRCVRFEVISGENGKEIAAR